MLDATVVETVAGARRGVAGAVVHRLGDASSGPGSPSDPARQQVSDADGRVCFRDLEPGEHAVLVVAEGFSVLEAVLSLDTTPRRVVLELTPAFGEEVVVTGTRTARKLADSPIPVRQVTRATIEASAARTLADAIELTPGVRIESNCQNCNFSQVRMLGLEGPYTQILVDGQPTVSSLALVYGVEQFPARALDSIEVVKGGGAALYGAGAVGGVVNLVPHSPLDTHATLEARATSTGGEPGHSLSVLGDWSPRARRTGVSLLAQHEDVRPADRDGDGFTEVTSRELTTVAVRAEHYLLGDQARLSGELNWTEAARRGGDLARFDRPPEETALTEQILTERLGFSLGFLHTVSSRLDYRLTASSAATSRDSYYGAGFDADAYGTTDNPLWLVDAQLNRHHEKGTWSVGASYRHDTIDDRQPGYGRLLRETHTNLGLYLQDDRTLAGFLSGSRAGDLAERITVVYGLRVDDHSALPAPVVSPRLAAMVSPRDDLTIRASFAHGFRAPVTFDEDLHIELAGGAARIVHPSADLVEERSAASLLSLEWRPTFGPRSKGSASVELAAFRTDLDDLFAVVERDDPRTPQREFLRVNTEGARVEGVEFALSVRWGSRWSTELGYVVQSARYDVPEPDFGVRRFLRTPDTYGTFSLQARLPAALDLFVGARTTGSMLAPHYAGFIDTDRLETTPSFVELDVALSRAFDLGARELTVTVGAKNLTDAYQRDLDQGPDRDSNYVYGPRLPRTLHVGLRWEL